MTADGCGIADVNLPQHSIKWREKSGLALTRTNWSDQIGMTNLSLTAADAGEAFERVEADTEFNRSAGCALPSALPDQPDTARRNRAARDDARRGRSCLWRGRQALF